MSLTKTIVLTAIAIITAAPAQADGSQASGPSVFTGSAPSAAEGVSPRQGPLMRRGMGGFRSGANLPPDTVRRPFRPRQAGIGPDQSLLSPSMLVEQPSIITGDEGTLLHPKPLPAAITPANPAGAPFRLQNGALMTNNPDGNRGITKSNGLINRDNSSFTTRGDGSTFSRLPDGTRSFTTKDGTFGQINPDGTGPRPDGSMVSKNAVDGSTTLSKNGYKLQQKTDGTTVFTRSNGIETERTKDGRIRMKQDGQYTNREIKF